MKLQELLLQCSDIGICLRYERVCLIDLTGGGEDRVCEEECQLYILGRSDMGTYLKRVAGKPAYKPACPLAPSKVARPQTIRRSDHVLPLL